MQTGCSAFHPHTTPNSSVPSLHTVGLHEADYLVKWMGFCLKWDMLSALAAGIGKSVFLNQMPVVPTTAVLTCMTHSKGGNVVLGPLYFITWAIEF